MEATAIDLGVVAGGGEDCPLLSGGVYLVPDRLVESLMGMMLSYEL